METNPDEARALATIDAADRASTGEYYRRYGAARVAEYAVALREASAARDNALGDEDIRALLVQYQAALIRNLR